MIGMDGIDAGQIGLLCLAFGFFAVSVIVF